MTPQDAYTHYEDLLTEYEKSELSQFQYIYTIGSKQIASKQQVTNAQGHYKCSIGE